MLRDKRAVTNLIAVAALTGAIGYGLLIWRRAPTIAGKDVASVAEPAVPSQSLTISRDRVMGTPAIGKLALIEFADFQCPYCIQFAQSIEPEIRRQYVENGRMVFAFKYLPLAPIHPFAVAAAEAAECAARQGSFWPAHDALFAQHQLDWASLSALASAHWSPEQRLQFEKCRAGEARDAIADDVALASALQIEGTPTFLLGVQDTSDTVRVLKRWTHLDDGVRTFDRMANEVLISTSR